MQSVLVKARPDRSNPDSSGCSKPLSCRSQPYRPCASNLPCRVHLLVVERDGRQIRNGLGIARINRIRTRYRRSVKITGFTFGATKVRLNTRPAATWADTCRVVIMSQQSASSTAGTLLTFHHPPIAVRHAPWTRDIGLRNADELAAIITGTDTRVVLCGHLQLGGPFAGTAAWVTPGVVSRFDLTAPPGLLRAVQGASASVIELNDDASPNCYLLHARDPDAGREVLVADPATWQLLDNEEE